MSELSRVLEDKRQNAIFSWVLTVVLWLVMIESLLEMNFLWAGFVGFVALTAILPALVYRDASIMLPWEVVLLASLPVLGTSVDIFASYAPLLRSPALTYLSVATVALIIAVELHMFTKVKMTHRFAVLFVVIATMAAAGVWAVLQWWSDLYLDTSFLHTNQTLMGSFLLATAAGLMGGIVFDWYFRRRRDKRLREQYEEVIQ